MSDTEEFQLSPQDAADELFLIQYLEYKIKKRDWKSVSEIANDLRAFNSGRVLKKQFLSADAGNIPLREAMKGTDGIIR